MSAAPARARIATNRILLVEEDRLLKDLLIRTLASEGRDVVEASSITAAKTIIVEREPAVVVVDAHLAEAIPFIFSLQSAKVPVIAMVKTDQSRDHLRLAGITAVDRRGSIDPLIVAIHSTLEPGLPVAVGAAHHILVVDDEESVRFVFSKILTQCGYVVSGARDGVEAMRILDLHPDISVVLLDVAMPRSGGLETLKNIVERRPRPGVIMLSALADKLVVERSVKLGAFGYILKPPDFSEVEGTISACIARAELTL